MSDDPRELVWASNDYIMAQENVRQTQLLMDLHKRNLTEAANELVSEIIRAGLTEYGPITSEMVWHEPSGSYRRIWKGKDDTAI